MRLVKVYSKVRVSTHKRNLLLQTFSIVKDQIANDLRLGAGQAHAHVLKHLQGLLAQVDVCLLVDYNAKLAIAHWLLWL